jgi:DNA invertase Pin-like site-specific DNA recombinase
MEAAGVILYLDAQNIDTTTPMGRLLFQVTGAFAEFERSMIKQRVQVGLNGINAKIAKDGKFETKAGIVRRHLGRPGAEPHQLEQARHLLVEGKGIINNAKACGLGTSTVQKLKREMLDAGGCLKKDRRTFFER